MNPYYNHPPLVDTFTDSSGTPHRIIKPQQLDAFKNAIENHINQLTYEINTMREHANWIEPRLHEFIKFNHWMEKAHPDIIEAYKKSTAVVAVLDKANDEYMYPQAETSA